jgi:glutamate N-acetyltransferase/amino-acid N-acetyltransferase
MIEPHMATLLVFRATNAAVDAPFLRRVLREACDGSFNRVTIDGCMSTSDTAVILASGTQCRGPLAPAGRSGKRFARMVAEVCRELAEAVVSDGEGGPIAWRFAWGRGPTGTRGCGLRGQRPVKTALRGESNWGRTSRHGASGADRPDRIGIRIGKAVILAEGAGWACGGKRPGSCGRRRIAIDLGAGRGRRRCSR